ncbi:unnamed protein product [Ectocarpus sp. 6 AP-2014]
MWRPPQPTNRFDSAGRWRVKWTSTGQQVKAHTQEQSGTTFPRHRNLRDMVLRVTKAHMASTRKDLSERQLLEEDRLHEDFVAQVVTSALLHTANNIAAHPVNEVGKHESIVCKCTRKARACGRLCNGGFSTTNARAYSKRVSGTPCCSS